MVLHRNTRSKTSRLTNGSSCKRSDRLFSYLLSYLLLPSRVFSYLRAILMIATYLMMIRSHSAGFCKYCEWIRARGWGQGLGICLRTCEKKCPGPDLTLIFDACLLLGSMWGEATLRHSAAKWLQSFHGMPANLGPQYVLSRLLNGMMRGKESGLPNVVLCRLKLDWIITIWVAKAILPEA